MGSRCGGLRGMLPAEVSGRTTLRPRDRVVGSLRGCRATLEGPSPASGVDTKWVEVGVVTGAHGLRGEIRVKPLTDSADERFRAGKKSWLKRRTTIFEDIAEPEQMSIEFVRNVTTRGKLAYLLKLDSVSSREEAEDMKGHTLLVKADEREELDGDVEFYVQDLFGLQVRLRQGVREEPIELGTVVDVYDGTGVHDTLDIEVCESYLQSVLPGGSEGGEGGKGQGGKRRAPPNGKGKVCVLVPFAREIVPVVDTEGGFCEIDPPEGLIEACLYRKKR